MRESWTDERLDDFRAETARRFDTLERRMDDGFDRVDAKLEKIDEKFERLEERLDLKFDRVNARFDDLYRAIIFLGGGAIVTFVVGFAGLFFTG